MDKPLESLECTTTTNIDSPKEVFRRSLRNGDPYSRNILRRQQWFDNIDLPRITGIDFATRMKLLGKGGFTRTYELDIDGGKYACQFVRHARWGSDSRGLSGEATVKRDYAGLLAAHMVDAEVFVAPYGGAANEKGKIVGLLVELVPGAEELRSFITEDGFFNLNHRKGKTLGRFFLQDFKKHYVVLLIRILFFPISPLKTFWLIGI